MQIAVYLLFDSPSVFLRVTAVLYSLLFPLEIFSATTLACVPQSSVSRDHSWPHTRSVEVRPVDTQADRKRLAQ